MTDFERIKKILTEIAEVCDLKYDTIYDFLNAPLEENTSILFEGDLLPELEEINPDARASFFRFVKIPSENPEYPFYLRMDTKDPVAYTLDKEGLIIDSSKKLEYYLREYIDNVKLYSQKKDKELLEQARKNRNSKLRWSNLKNISKDQYIRYFEKIERILDNN